MHLKLLQKEQFKRKKKQLVIWLVTALLIKLQKNHPKILYRQLKVKQKYQTKDIYLQKKDSKLLTN